MVRWCQYNVTSHLDITYCGKGCKTPRYAIESSLDSEQRTQDTIKPGLAMLKVTTYACVWEPSLAWDRRAGLFENLPAVALYTTPTPLPLLSTHPSTPSSPMRKEKQIEGTPRAQTFITKNKHNARNRTSLTPRYALG